MIKKKLKDCTVEELVSCCTCTGGTCGECSLNGTEVCSCLSYLEECEDLEINIPDKEEVSDDEEISDDEEFIVVKKNDTFLFDKLNKSDLVDACEPSKEWYVEQCKKLEHENHRLRKLVRILLDEIPEE